MIKVSVIVPVYNIEKYLRECMDSIISQTLKEIEIICVDDGSTDGSPGILDRYAAVYDNIKVIHQQNQGYGSAVNTGINISKGQYIGIVDSDDFISPYMYEKLYGKAVLLDADFVKSNFFEVKGSAPKYKLRHFNTISKEYEKIQDSTGERSKKAIFDYRTMKVWTGIYKLSFIKENGIEFNESPGAAFQDNGFWFQTAVCAKRVGFLNDAFYYYRKDNMGSSIHDKDKVYDIVGEYNFIREFLKKDNERFKEYYKYFVIQKYYAYIDNFRRISEKHKLPFLRKAAKEFESDISKMNEIETDSYMLDEYAVGEMLRIVDSPEIYYYESSVDRLKKAYKKIDEDFYELKNIMANGKGKL